VTDYFFLIINNFFSAHFLIQLRNSPDFSSLTLCITFALLHPSPIFIFLLTLIIPSIFHFMNYVVHTLGVTNHYILSLHNTILQSTQTFLLLNAGLEYFVFITLLLELFFSFTSNLFLLLFIDFNFLRDRYRTSGASQFFFHHSLSYLNGLAHHPNCPHFLRDAYLRFLTWSGLTSP
jgi:hypothetical protein